MLLVKPAIIEIALDGPMVGHGVAAVERDQRRFVLGGLRPGENRAIVVGEQFDRRRSDHAEEIVCCGRDQMDLGIGALPAEIAVEARKPRWRLVAPAVVLEAFRGEIEPPFSVAHPVLQGPADAAVGAARGIEFGAAVGEASFIWKLIAPPRALRPKVGLLVQISERPIATFGIKSQLTVSPKASLTRIPCM